MDVVRRAGLAEELKERMQNAKCVLYMARVDPKDREWFVAFAEQFHVNDYGVAFKELIRFYCTQDMTKRIDELERQVEALKTSMRPGPKPVTMLNGKEI